MADLPPSPYRTQAIAARRPGAPARRPGRGTWLWATAIAAGAVAGALGAPLGMAASGAAMLGAMAHLTFTSLRRTRAQNRVRALPFPIRHDRVSAIDSWSMNPSAIREVTVRLARPLDGLAAERVAGDAIARAPGLSAATHGDTIVLTAWTWGKDDMLLLARLLATWGHELHAEHTITEVFVTWARGGPTGSI